MKEVLVNKDLVAHCGLYCGACGAYLKGRCPGCHENVKAGWVQKGRWSAYVAGISVAGVGNHRSAPRSRVLSHLGLP
jgi:hypothetical protein